MGFSVSPYGNGRYPLQVPGIGLISQSGFVENSRALLSTELGRLGVGYLRRAFATCAAVTADAELPQELRI
jgi:hypothetical protein